MDGPFEIDLPTASARRSLKWLRYPPDVIPLWVAEMDFAPAPAVTERLAQQLARGDYGYPPEPPPMPVSEFRAAVASWQQRRHGWEAEPDFVSVMPDAMRVVEIAIARFTEPGDPVALPDPVYHPFREVIEAAARVPTWVPMTRNGERWELDLDALAVAFERSQLRLFLHCNPHNPTGTVFTAAEQRAIAELAERHDVIVVSDEVHADLTLGSAHTPFATVTPSAPARTITASAASKTFNLAGLRCGYAIAGSRELHRQIQMAPMRDRKLISLPGYEATIAAYSGGESWLKALQEHLTLMRDHAIDRLRRLDHSLVAARPGGTYLLWTDWRKVGLGPDPAGELLARARVALSPGGAFGPSGDGYARLNFATSREILDTALDRIEAAL